MLSDLTRLRERFTSTFWFFPVLMSMAGFFTALASITLDVHLGACLPDAIAVESTEAARAILTTLVASLISVTGVVYSMMIVALSFSSNALGPRLLRDFMRRKQPKVILGGLVATVVFSLLVLAAIEKGRIPQISILVATVVALGALLSLLFFLQQVAVGMQADHVIERISDRALRSVEKERGPVRDRDEEDEPGRVRAPKTGYLASINLEGLCAKARDCDVRVSVESRPGRFVMEGALIASVEPAPTSDGDWSTFFAIEHTRTESQDLEYHLQEIVEIALRALSPGINDPFTAISCVDQLTGLLHEIARRPEGRNEIFDEGGSLRVSLPKLALADLIDTAFRQIRQAARDHLAVSLRLLEGLDQLAEMATRAEDRESIRRYARVVHQEIRREDLSAVDCEQVAERMKNFSV
jgi:uncharacterized membrane protein